MRRKILDIVLPHSTGDVRSDNDLLYFYKVLNHGIYKIGVSSQRLGQWRVADVLKKHGYESEWVRYFKVKNAVSLEKILHQLGSFPNEIAHIDGWTEFREFTPKQVTKALKLIAESNAIEIEEFSDDNPIFQPKIWRATGVFYVEAQRRYRATIGGKFFGSFASKFDAVLSRLLLETNALEFQIIHKQLCGRQKLGSDEIATGHHVIELKNASYKFAVIADIGAKTLMYLKLSNDEDELLEYVRHQNDSLDRFIRFKAIKNQIYDCGNCAQTRDSLIRPHAPFLKWHQLET
jgi:hypothetical protein